MLLNMANLNRDVTSLLNLQPATSSSVGVGDVYGGQVAGSMSDQNIYMLDGGNMTSDLEATTTTPPEACGRSRRRSRAFRISRWLLTIRLLTSPSPLAAR